MLAIIDYIADDNVTAAQEMKDTIESRVANLPLHPRLYKEGREPGTPRDGRTSKLHRYLQVRERQR
ncbi:type II toxin-antitoxin system RelE/ParE family toxin [Pseudomonas syringae]